MSAVLQEQQEPKRACFPTAWIHAVLEPYEDLITLHPGNVSDSVPDGNHFIPLIIIHKMQSCVDAVGFIAHHISL